jgi:glutamate synthase domain-containing protein 1
MKTNSVETEMATAANNAQSQCSPDRFVIFVAGGGYPIISFKNFARAERIAVFFADLTNVRMEVFDSVKEICYFIEPAQINSALVH